MSKLRTPRPVHLWGIGTALCGATYSRIGPLFTNTPSSATCSHCLKKLKLAKVTERLTR